MKVKFDEISLEVWIILAALLIGAVAVILLSRKKKLWTTQLLAHGAICIAISFILSYIRLFKLPQGGSVTLASMLPIMAFSYLYGITPGLLVSASYSVLQLIQNPEIYTPAQAILDYPLAFGCLALAGLGKLIWKNSLSQGKGELASWITGIAAASLGRYVCHALSGYIFFAEYAISQGMAPILYTLAYNSFVLVEGAICMAIIAVPAVRTSLKRISATKI